MRILLTGGTGLIGRELGKALAARGDEVVCLVRDFAAARRRLPFPATCHAWRHTQPVPAAALAGVDAVLHLAGEPVADKRWTDTHKALIRDSRVLGTRALVQAVLAHGTDVRVFVHGSASGFHGERGDELLDAHSSAGMGFLPDVVRAWEAELEPLTARPAMRVPVVRTGIVLARQGGALAQMLPLFRLSAAGRLGDGAQWMSWIHLQDIVGLFLHALDAPAANGVLEGVAPQPVTNAQFTRAFTRSLGAIQNLPVPRAAIQALYGERADIVLGSTRLVPTATLASGYRFRFETVEHALEDLLAPLRGGVWERVWEQWLPQPASEVWPFFASADNLEEITPPFLNFKVLGMSTPEIGAGTRIDYTLRINGLPVRWQTLIDAWEPPHRFSDIQARGPYDLWRHVHEFIPMAGGTLMRDTVHYRLPAGWLGMLAAGWKVGLDVERIFSYRAEVIDARFGSAAR